MESDIVVVGNNFTSLILIHKIIKEKSNLKTTYFYNENLIRNSLFLPSFVYPLMSLSSEKIKRTLNTALDFFNELFYTTKSIDLSKSSLLILNRTVRETKEMYSKLKKAKIYCDILRKVDIEQTLPLLNSERYNKALITDSSLIINNLGALAAHILDELKNLNVKLIEYKKDQINYNQNNKTLFFKKEKITASRFLIITDHTIIPHQIELTNILAAKTPLVENFPRINLIDNITKLFIHMETGGYLNLFQLSLRSEKERILKQLSKNFTNLFPLIRDFNILDYYLIKTVKEPYFKLNEKTVEIYSPFHMELNLLPSLLKKLVPEVQKGKLNKIDF